MSTITRETLDDQINLEIDDVVRNAGGVISAGDGFFADRIFIRGLEVGSRNFRKDGFLDPTIVPRDFQNVERIEILKGPASMLYGAGDPAGLVNVITKKPVNDRFANFGYTFGAYQQNRYMLDANGFGNESGSVLYRLNIAQEERDNFVDFDYLRRVQIAPVVTWLIDPSTTLTWNGEYHRDHRLGFQGTPAVGGNALFLPPDRFVGEPDNDFFRGEEFRQSLMLTHEFDNGWVWTLGGNSLFYTYPGSSTVATSDFGLLPPPFGFNLPPAAEPNFYRLQFDSADTEEQSQSVVTNLAGEFWTGDILHKGLVGVEYNYFNSQGFFGASTPLDFGAPPFFIQQFDVTNPSYTNPPVQPLFSLTTNAFRQQRVGAYMQDYVEVNDYWKLLGAVRFDTVDFTFDRVIDAGLLSGAGRIEENFDRVSPRAGVVYQPWGDDVLSYYYSYSQSFTPPGGGAFQDFGQPILPVLGQGHEAGFKVLVLPDLSLTACGFHISRENDTFVTTPNVLTQVGEVRSQGAELNMLGQITDYWSVIANYTYTDTVVSDLDPLIDGRRARNVPFNTANLWTRYNVFDDGYETAGMALGIVYVGDRAAALRAPDPFQAEFFDVRLPEYTRWDSGLYYRRGQMNANVYMENLFDEQYAQSSVNNFQIFQGAPFNVRATISYLY